ncbi:MAG: hypothetical protein FWD61_05395 [Phycisphaerales bacterium]|nr:hypothetical protein [Phycisphaerales bacterium]
MKFNLANALLCPCICIAAFVIVAGCLLGGCGQQSGEAKGETALDQVLGEHGLRGKVVLVQFGMVGCANSDEGLKRMIAIHRLAPSNLHFLRVEQGENEAAITSYYRTTTPSFPVHRDLQFVLAQAVKALFVIELPEFDAGGVFLGVGDVVPEVLAEQSHEEAARVLGAQGQGTLGGGEPS